MAKTAKSADKEEKKKRRTRRASSAAAVPESAPKRRSKKSDVDLKESVSQAFFNPVAMARERLNKIERKFDLVSGVLSRDEPRFSTGLISLDLLINGGLVAGGWYTAFGGEQSCKSTLAMTIVASILRNNFQGYSAYFDYEGSVQFDYFEAILKNARVKVSAEDVFGVKDEDGNYTTDPLVYYASPDTGEQFFSSIAELERILPDKLCMKGQWYYIYANNKENQKMLKGKYDKKYFAKHNKFRVPAEDGSLQAIILTDSYPAMNPESMDEKEDGDNSLGLQARMFAKQIPRIKTKMKKKRIVIVGINQLRENIGVRYGPTEREPCGNALKFNSDCRLRTAKTVIPHGKGYIEEEQSIKEDGGIDYYAYINVKTVKNKLGGRPLQTVTLRTRIGDADGEPTGFCMTWDAWNYLKSTGQISGQRDKIKFGEGLPYAGSVFSWLEFKILIEGSKSQIKELCAKKGVKAKALRLWLEDQCNKRGGELALIAEKRAIEEKKAKKLKKAASGDDDDDDAED